jgi:hypothetical protein
VHGTGFAGDRWQASSHKIRVERGDISYKISLAMKTFDTYIAILSISL